MKKEKCTRCEKTIEGRTAYAKCKPYCKECFYEVKTRTRGYEWTRSKQWTVWLEKQQSI